MGDKNDRLHKPDGPERRLKLKKYKESIGDKVHLLDNFNNECKESNIPCTSQSADNNDSISDFKSPKRIHSVQSKTIHSNRVIDKSKKKVLHSKAKITNSMKYKNKSLQNEKVKHEMQLSSIESSFFKSEKKVETLQNSDHIKMAHVCPICFKTFKNENLQTMHMKSCALKNNVSTKKLLNVVELQERQAAERKSLGLLSAPILQERKKPAACKTTIHEDSDLQLALALSESLYEKEEMEKWDKAKFDAISFNSLLSNSNEEYPQKTTLQTFGFTSNRNISPTNSWPTNKIKRRKPIEPTILQRRTKTERENILTEKIAEILMDHKDFTQNYKEDWMHPKCLKKKIVLKSQLLQQLYQNENTLWDKTRLMATQDIFYVSQLSPQITPPLPNKIQKVNENENVAMITDHDINDKKYLYKQEIFTGDEVDVNKQSTISSNAFCQEKKFVDALITNWGNILNDSSASDVIIIVKNCKHIWVHKLVFYVRCPDILLDIFPNDTELQTVKEKISWNDIDYDIALAFLEFIYCGIINRYSKVLDSNTSLSCIRALARKYKMNDLFTYLRHIEVTSDTTEIKQDIYKENLENMHGKLKEGASQFSQKTLLQKDMDDALLSSKNNYVSAENLHATLQFEETVLRSSLKDNSCKVMSASLNLETTSPDMFDDTFDIMKDKNISIEHYKNGENSNIHVLLNLIRQDVDISSQKSLSEQACNAEYAKSIKNIPISSKTEEQNVIEIDAKSNSNSSLKLLSNNLYENSISFTPQSSKLKIVKDNSSNIGKQKSNLTLFIEQMQKENAKSDSNLSFDMENSNIQASSTGQKNPFHINQLDESNQINTNFESYNNIKQSGDAGKKPGRLSIIEQCMLSDAEKNPDFYCHFIRDYTIKEKQNDVLHSTFISPEKVTKSPSNINHFMEDLFSPVKKHVNQTSDQNAFISMLPLNEIAFNSDTEDKEISMYSKYIRSHKHNSIAKYRTEIRKSKSDNVFNNSTSSNSSNENNGTENDEAQIACILSQKNHKSIIVSSDSEVESVSSVVSCPIVIQNKDSNYDDMSHSTYMQQFRKRTKDMKNEGNNQSLKIQNISQTKMIDLEEDKEVVSNKTIADSGELNINNRETISDTDFNAIFTSKKSRLNESDESKINDYKDKINLSLITSPHSDCTNIESLEQNAEYCSKDMSCTYESKSQSANSFNFENDIYLANVDINRYDIQCASKESQSTITSSKTESKRTNIRKFNKRNSNDNITYCNSNKNLMDHNSKPIMQSSMGVKNFKKKSLSEGHININRIYDQEDMSKCIPTQFQSSYNHNIGNIKTTYKIIKKGVTPPLDYDTMKTPELHKEMKKYGLKIQKRSRAIKLLTHIYNELHPLVPITEIRKKQKVTKSSSDEEEGPPMKKPNILDNSEISNDVEETNNKICCSQESNESISSITETVSKEMEYYETESIPSLENSSAFTEVFAKLITIDKDLHNKILQYEPVNIKELHSMLRMHGLKCNISNLMTFLDEQCITFYSPEHSVKNRIRKKA